MNKKDWHEHCKWLDTFRGRIITNNPVYKDYVKKEKKSEKKSKRKISGYYFNGKKLIILYEEKR